MVVGADVVETSGGAASFDPRLEGFRVDHERREIVAVGFLSVLGGAEGDRGDVAGSGLERAEPPSQAVIEAGSDPADAGGIGGGVDEREVGERRLQPGPDRLDERFLERPDPQEHSSPRFVAADLSQQVDFGRGEVPLGQFRVGASVEGFDVGAEQILRAVSETADDEAVGVGKVERPPGVGRGFDDRLAMRKRGEADRPRIDPVSAE